MSDFMRHNISDALAHKFLRDLHPSDARVSSSCLNEKPFLKELYDIMIDID